MDYREYMIKYRVNPLSKIGFYWVFNGLNSVVARRSWGKFNWFRKLLFWFAVLPIVYFDKWFFEYHKERYHRLHRDK